VFAGSTFGAEQWCAGQVLAENRPPSFPGAPNSTRETLEAAAWDILRHMRASEGGAQDASNEPEHLTEEQDAGKEPDPFDFLEG